MDDGGLTEKPERRDLWTRALTRPDRQVERKLDREPRAPQRQERKTRPGGRK